MKMLSRKEVADSLGVSVSYVGKLIRSGRMLSERGDRGEFLIPESEVERFQEKRKRSRGVWKLCSAEERAPTRLRLIEMLLDDSMTVQDIAQELRVNEQRVRELLTELQVPRYSFCEYSLSDVFLMFQALTVLREVANGKPMRREAQELVSALSLRLEIPARDNNALGMLLSVMADRLGVA